MTYNIDTPNSIATRAMATILFFASLKDRTGVDKIEIPLLAPIPLADVVTLAADQTGLDVKALAASARFAINHTFCADMTTLVENHDEVAALPPLSGGI
jgi:molybdopterin converting factor small subunit